MPDVPYDFSGLHRPMSRSEARERRRAVLAGKSLWSALEIEHYAGVIVVGGIHLFLLIPASVVLVIAAVLAADAVRSVSDAVGWVLIVVGVPLAVAAVVFFSMRLLLIPPRWRAWVRMHRFAEENGIAFVREELGVQVRGSLVPQRRSFLPPRLYDGFRDEARGIILGDWVLPAVTPRGFADWMGVIEVRADHLDEQHRLGYAGIRELLGDTAGSWSIEVQTLPGAVVAVKQLPFRTRKPANLERAFRIAWALHEAAHGERGAGPLSPRG